MHFSWVFSATILLVGTVSAHPTTTKQEDAVKPQSYEYVVVGSGPGGGPLAARLAIAGFKVLLLDAGDDQGASPLYQLPILHLAASEFGPMKWDYYVNHYRSLAQQKKDSKMTYRTKSGTLYVGLDPPKDAKPLGILYPRAGTLGGCSAHNALITVYPHKSDWTYIAGLTGDSSWKPSAMRKYFKRLEKADYLPKGMSGHGYDGWLNIGVPDLKIVFQDQNLRSILVAAATATSRGFSRVVSDSILGLRKALLQDVNYDTDERDSAEGLYQMPLAVRDGTRNGPREFVLATANAVKSDGTRKYYLDIKLETLVTKVRFSKKDGSKPRAVGVDFLSGKSLYRADPRAGEATSGIPGSVNATREVILSAGAFNTPQLLKLSGIGPNRELASFGIPLVVDLPGVGTNMQDRYETSIITKSPIASSATENCTFLQTPTDPCFEQWSKNAGGGDRGIYAVSGLPFGIVKKSSVAEGDADLYITGAPVKFPGYYPNYSNDATADFNHWTWVMLKAHTRNNAGTVQLASKDPRDIPLINFNSFNDNNDADKDVKALVEGMEFSREMLKQLKPKGLYSEVWPGTSVKGKSLRDFIRAEAWGHHASCTCPIGRDGDRMAVLDSKFQVRGTTGLRVVDASVFPKIPGFYMTVPTYMISEKAADVIIAAAKGH